MRTYSIDEIEKIMDNSTYKSVALYDVHGEKIKPFNGPKSSEGMDGRWKEILECFESPAINDRHYVIYLRHGMEPGSKIDQFPIDNPCYDADHEHDPAPQPASGVNPGLSQPAPQSIIGVAEAVQLMSQVEILKAKLEGMEERLAEQDEYIEDLEKGAKELSEQPQQTAAQSTWGNTITNMMPVVDKFLENQAERNNLMKMHLFMNSPEYKMFMMNQMMQNGQLNPQMLQMMMQNGQVNPQMVQAMQLMQQMQPNPQTGFAPGDPRAPLMEAAAAIANRDGQAGQTIYGLIMSGQLDKAQQMISSYGGQS